MKMFHGHGHLHLASHGHSWSQPDGRQRASPDTDLAAVNSLPVKSAQFSPQPPWNVYGTIIVIIIIIIIIGHFGA